MYLERVPPFEINNFVTLWSIYIFGKKWIFLYFNLDSCVFHWIFFWSMCVCWKKNSETARASRSFGRRKARYNEIAIVVAQFFFFFKYFFSVSYIILAGATSWFRPSTSPIFFHFFPFGSHRVVYLRLEVCLASTHSRMPCQLHFVAENSVQANEMIKRIDIFTWNQISLNLWTRARACVCVLWFLNTRVNG